uniref:Uncharacterized protein n=1 Tax=Glossina pallidipes TaxID=7398 RepID=A0A1B0A899_GLOPL
MYIYDIVCDEGKRVEIPTRISLLLWKLLRTDQSHSSLIDTPDVQVCRNLNNRESHSNKKQSIT